MKNYKVCILTSVHPVFDTRIFYKEAKTLMKAGYDVTLIAQHNKNENVDGIRIIPLPEPRNRLERMTKTVCMLFNIALREKPAICHFHDPELIPIGIILKLLGKKVIYDVHEDYGKQNLYKTYIPVAIRKPVAKLVSFIEKIASKFFDRIIVATDDILKNFITHKGSVAIRNFPVLTNFGEIQKKRNNQMFAPIYIGALAETRGITQIVEAMEYFDIQKNIKLILCGGFSPKSYEKKVRCLKGFERVEYLGYIKHTKVTEYLAQADVGIVCFHPTLSHINSMPNKLFEYMCAGIPVVASNFPLWKKIIERNKCGICVNPLEPREIAKAIEYLMEHSDEAQKMGANGKEAILQKYNWENESKKLLKVYEELCKK